ncbi:Ger(x)C family spore germination protein [Cohnella silvisoli]|uniref:Ger(X)C family spore germination protein n=1 Tax=Cohnella silvisoli TaxID=2873699 RepID=A0ABV1KY74_9BACL|nr:Ger(x)C family spore germination protein [Cohnella silvisoli]MCD9021791.1 Ger(x)C family spore germination protein [Cohnella silvisoli]
MKRFLMGLISLLFALILTSCWDIKSLQDVNYFTGIGIDYKNNKYQIYIQQLNFSSVAKTEGGKLSTPAEVWVGHAEGESISQAVIELYQTTQQTVFWGHLSSIILSEDVLKHGNLLAVFDALMRSPEIRYTPWIYGSKKDMRELLTTKPFFNLSPLNSILYSPETNYNQRPIITPMRTSQFIRDLREPGKMVFLPSLSISDGTWTANKKPDPKLEVDGVFAMHDDSFKSWVDYKDLTGLRWFKNRTLTSRIFLRKNNSNVATLKIAKPKSKIRINISNGEPVFNIEVSAAAILLELWTQTSEKELENLANKLIAEEIRSTFQNGMKRQIDLLRLEHVLYRKKFKLWKKLTSNGKVALHPIKLGEVTVKIKVVQSGMYKLKRKMTPH